MPNLSTTTRSVHKASTHNIFSGSNNFFHLFISCPIPCSLRFLICILCTYQINFKHFNSLLYDLSRLYFLLALSTTSKKHFPSIRTVAPNDGSIPIDCLVVDITITLPVFFISYLLGYSLLYSYLLSNIN